MRVIGVDFSLSSPAICLMEGEDFSFSNCKFLFLTSKKSLQNRELMGGRFIGLPFRTYNTDTERFLKNAHDIKRWVKPTAESHIYIEGYSFGSQGSRLFQIGEAAGILKTLLIHDEKGNLINAGRNICALAPSAIKKFATGKGNADKEMMYRSFVEDTNINLAREFNQTGIVSPVNDLVDAYWICKYGFHLQKTQPM